MPFLTALAISIGVLGGIATWLCLGPLAPDFQIWALFIAWGAYFHCGGGIDGLKAALPAHIAGAVVAWITLLVVSKIAVGLPLPVWAGLCVGVGVFVMVLLANLPLLAAIPAMVYGFASVAAYSLLANKLGDLTSPSLANPAVAIILSMILGTLFGFVSAKAAGAIGKND
jgi:hypothetical protein